jgi:hypothetical protein
MPLVGLDYAKDLKAIIFDLDALALRTVLWAFVDKLTKEPSVRMADFVDFVIDAQRYHRHRKEINVSVGVPGESGPSSRSGG